MSNYNLIFDEVILHQLKKLEKQKDVKDIISSMLDKIEVLGSRAGDLLDIKLNLYECKNKKPPIRLYFKVLENEKEIYVFEFEMKTSEKKQNKTIDRLRKRVF